MWQSRVEIKGFPLQALCPWALFCKTTVSHMWQSRVVIPPRILIASLPSKLRIAESVKGGAHMRFVDPLYSCIYEARMSPTLNRRSVIWRFKHSNAIEICDRITTRDCHICKYSLHGNHTVVYLSC